MNYTCTRWGHTAVISEGEGKLEQAKREDEGEPTTLVEPVVCLFQDILLQLDNPHILVPILPFLNYT